MVDYFPNWYTQVDFFGGDPTRYIQYIKKNDTHYMIVVCQTTKELKFYLPCVKPLKGNLKRSPKWGSTKFFQN